MIRLPQVIQADPLPGNRLKLVFERGEQRIFDMTPYIRPGTVFEPLQDDAVFSSVKLGLGTIVWPNGADFDPETLFARSVPIESIG